jgi:putative heme iron utilization protein
MTFSEFLEVLKKHKIDYEYDGWNHSSILQINAEEEHEYSFRIFLKEDDDSDIANQPITKFKNPISVIEANGKIVFMEGE